MSTDPTQHLSNQPGVPDLTPCMNAEQVVQLLHNRYTAKSTTPPCGSAKKTLPPSSKPVA
ncbi:MAG: hypothetical protein U1U88_001273 [Lawsonella clevelandensis]